MHASMLIKTIAASALVALTAGCVAVDDPYYQGGGYGGGYSTGYSTYNYGTYTPYPAWQAA